MSAAATTIFDQKHYRDLIEARGDLIRTLVPQLVEKAELTTALDAGCGLGFFSQTLHECGLKVLGVDGRETNVKEAARRYPEVTFETRDIEDSSTAKIGKFDFVLCFGLLYHLENPLRAMRHLRALTGKVLLLESMCLPDVLPFALLREESALDDQSLTNLAFYPSEGCIVKMLYGSGFKWVYRLATMPDHHDFRETPGSRRARTVIIASFSPLKVPGIEKLEEPHEAVNPWAKESIKGHGILPRAQRFLKQPLRQKASTVVFRGLLKVPQPVHLSFGARWIPRGDHIGGPAQNGDFEKRELLFVERFLKPGMTVLDIGAHHGLYSLLASRMVGGSGKVFSFEPSPRERKALRLNLRLNWSTNVSVQGIAMGSQAGESVFYIVDGDETGCNSLRPPEIQSGSVRPTKVRVERLDDWTESKGITSVNFVKLDVEGAELDVLKGASRLLGVNPRPVFLVELYDIRTEPWGYKASEIVQFLHDRRYSWFHLDEQGSIFPARHDLRTYDANLVAVPEELATELTRQLGAEATCSNAS